MTHAFAHLRARHPATHRRGLAHFLATVLASLCSVVCIIGLIACGNIVPPATLHAAIKSGDAKAVAKLIADEHSLEAQEAVQVGVLRISRNMTPLQHAAFTSHVDIGHLLLKGGAAVNKADSFGITALHIACGSEHEDMAGKAGSPPFGRLPTLAMIQLLLDHGANVNAPDATGCTPLMVAAPVASSGVLQELLKRGADVHATADVGNTVLGESIRNLDSSVIGVLVSAGANPEAPNGVGATALMLAAFEGRTSAAQTLLAAGANPFAKDASGFDAIDYATGRAYPLRIGSDSSRAEIVKMIQAARTTFNTTR